MEDHTPSATKDLSIKVCLHECSDAAHTHTHSASFTNCRTVELQQTVLEAAMLALRVMLQCVHKLHASHVQNATPNTTPNMHPLTQQ